MRILFLLALPVLMLANACDPDCDDPGRIKGTFAMWSNVVTHEPSEVPADYPSMDLFYNGWSQWDLTWVPNQSNFDLVMDGQKYAAAYEASSESCNLFGLAFGGDYLTPSDFTTAFQWNGELHYLGSCLSGTFTYEATWVDPKGAAQQVSATGEVTGKQVEGEFETGFCGG